MANLSQFPNQIDTFQTHVDISYSDVVNINRYKELLLKENRTTEEDVELNNLINTLRPKLFIPDDLNKLQDCIINMETFTKDTFGNYYKFRGDYTMTPNPTYEIYNSVRGIDGCIYLAITKPSATPEPLTNTGVWLQISTKGDKGTIWTGDYSELANYEVDDLIYYQGSTYICIQNATAGILPTNTSYFSLFSKKGDNGTNLPYRGKYNASTTYVTDDLVTRLGSIYRCKQTNMGILPESDTSETYWEVFMSGSGENLADLQTDHKTSLVGAINEVNSNTDTNTTNIGNLYNLTTIEKTSLVGAVSEVKNEVATHKAEDATTSTKGHVQLTDSVSSTSVTTAATPKNVKQAYDLANAAIPKSLATAANDFLVASGAGVWGKKTLAEVRTLLACLLTTGGTMAGELNCNDNLLTRPYIKDYAEVIGTTPATTGTVTLDLSTGNTFIITPTGAVTFAFSNPPASGRVGSFTLIINNGATVYAKTFPASVQWDNATIPDMSTASKTIILTFVTINGGARWYGFAGGTKFTT